MSDERGDCKHGHASDVAVLAKQIGRDHGMDVISSVLVLIGPDGTPPTVIGRYNTTALAVAADAVLGECATHTPDGCIMCDPSARAAKVALDVLRTEFPRQQAVHNRRRAN